MTAQSYKGTKIMPKQTRTKHQYDCDNCYIPKGEHRCTPELLCARQNYLPHVSDAELRAINTIRLLESKPPLGMNQLNRPGWGELDNIISTESGSLVFPI